MNYSCGDIICSGVVIEPDSDKPYDVIRLCIEGGENRHTYDYTPDEAHSIIMALSHGVGDWMSNTKVYQKFRKGTTEPENGET